MNIRFGNVPKCSRSPASEGEGARSQSGRKHTNGQLGHLYPNN